MDDNTTPTTADTLNLDPYWLPYTANRAFKNNPRIIDSAQGFYYRTREGRTILDSFSGLWSTGLEAHVKCFEQGLMVRHGMDTLAFSPFLTFTPDLLEQTFDTVRKALNTID